MLTSLAALALGVGLVRVATSPPAANAGMIVAVIGVVCFALSALRWGFG